MRKHSLLILAALALSCAAPAIMLAQKDTAAATPAIGAAIGYLDSRIEWWVHWPNAARDHDTSCVSCHTALPYALARPAFHAALKDHETAPGERVLLANVVKRVRLWR